jgi:hypothetical protein
MVNHCKFFKELTRREFFKKSALIAAGALGYSLGTRTRPTRASTSGVTGNRVVWAQDPSVTFWDGVSGYYGDYVSQARVDAMMEKGIKELTEESNVVSAWQQIIPDYSPGKKIAIKINVNNCFNTSCSQSNTDALPQPVNGLIAGLKSIGVQEEDIYVMEPSRTIPSHIGNPILSRYPNVILWEGITGTGICQKVTFDSGDPSLTIHHSKTTISDSYLADQLGEATYLINMPIMRGHALDVWGAGVTLTFKNNFGLIKPWTPERYHPYSFVASEDYSYDENPLHDLYLNSHIKDKTVLIVGDALFGSWYNNQGAPGVWSLFGGKFPNSIFLSTDPVAIDSVMFDFLNAEWARHANADLYLHRAVELGLGTHEHWNNATDKEYSVIDFRKMHMPAVYRSEIDQKIADFKAESATEQEVKDKINGYME